MSISNRLLSAISIVQQAQTKLVNVRSTQLNQATRLTVSKNIYSGDPSSSNFGVSGRSFNPESNLPTGAIKSGELIDCPTEYRPGDVVDQFVDYGKPLGSDLFHCGYDGIKEDRAPTGLDDTAQQECFYDEKGNLVDKDHEYADCGGSPNSFDADGNPVAHTVIDPGGILRNGLQGAAESIHHTFDNAVDSIQEGFGNLVDKFTGGDDAPTPPPTPEPSPTPAPTEHKSSADERQEEADRNSAGHSNPGSDAGTEELSGYAG